MNEANQECLSKLYFLRAALAKISINSESIVAKEKEFEKCDQNVNSAIKANLYSKSEINLMEMDIDKINKEIELAEKENDQKEYQDVNEDKISAPEEYEPIKDGKIYRNGDIKFVLENEAGIISPSSGVEYIVRKMQLLNHKKAIQEAFLIKAKSPCQLFLCFMYSIALPILVSVALLLCSVLFQETWLYIASSIAIFASILWFVFQDPVSRIKESNSKICHRKIKELEEKISETEEQLKEEERIRNQAKINAQKRMEERRLNQLNHKKSQLKTKEEQLEKKKEVFDKRLNVIDTLTNKKDDVRNQIISLSENSENTYQLAKESTKGLIDERDWKYLDIIIYELETGRADTMKEALQQTDLYVRHDEIKKAIHTASEAISAGIKQGIGELKHSIGLQVTALRADISELDQTQKDIRGKLGDMLDAQELSNALLEKSNVSSERLAEDVARMRQLREREYYGTDLL